MKHDLPTKHWKWLRRLAREGPTVGRELRFGCGPSGRRTDLARLLDLLAWGLIERTSAPPAPPVPSSEPNEFRDEYRLTEAGRGAAEYGEYERPASVRDRKGGA